MFAKIGGAHGFPILVKTDRGFGEVGERSLQSHLGIRGVHHASTLPYTSVANVWVESIRKSLGRVLEKYSLLRCEKS